jgi:integrase
MSDDERPERARMSKAAHRLTAKKIERLKAPGRYHDGHGLYFQITESGARSWLYRYEHGGRERAMGLGPARLYSLKEARALRDEAEKRLRAGEDPLDAKRAKRAAAKLDDAKAVTFAQAAERFLTAHEGAWKNAVHRHDFRQTLVTYAFPIIGGLPVAAIDTNLVLKVLEPIWTAKQTAQRLRGRIERVLDWAKARGLREGENPARWKGHLDHLLQKPNGAAKHHAAMAYADLPAFMGELRAAVGISPRALEIAILTALRTGEVIGAKWTEIDLAKREWIIPAERMKMEREHRIPLSPRVVEILEELPREADNPFVFIGERRGRPINPRALFNQLASMRPGLTVHGFRSSFRDWAAERTNVDHAVAEAALAHQVGSAVERAYRRTDLYDKRRALMEQWEKFCMNPEPTGSVVQGPWSTMAQQ